MKKILIHNAEIVNENKIFAGSVYIEDDKIVGVYRSHIPGKIFTESEIIDATGKYLIPGVIDDQVHFREPGLTHKGEIFTESMAAVAGGITSFMEMPNTNPQTTTIELLEEKYKLGAQKSVANYSFYLGATNNNLAELIKIDNKTCCGIKVFMGSSTGNMLVDNREVLDSIFAQVPALIAVHCEDEATILKNKEEYRKLYGDDPDIKYHPKIRDNQACFLSSSLAVELAQKHNSRLHLLHLSTKEEMTLLENINFVTEKRITAEVCVHHLLFDDRDYETMGSLIKWNPSIKSEADKYALLTALHTDKIDVIATDHAPHTFEEKQGGAFKAMSGGPMVQHALLIMLEMFREGLIPLEKVVQKMCHAPATVFKIRKRGFIREGFYADLVLIDPNKSWEISKDNLLYKCGWSPLEGKKMSFAIETTFVNGHKVWHNNTVDQNYRGMRLEFAPDGY